MGWNITNAVGAFIIVCATMLQATQDLLGADSVWVKLLWQRDGAPSSTWDAVKKALSDFPSEETARREFPDRYDEILQYKPRAWNCLFYLMAHP